MRRSIAVAAILAAWLGGMASPALYGQGSKGNQSSGKKDDGWKIPQGAEDEKSPLTISPAVIAAGKKLFASKCERCHGKSGKGNGPDSEPKYREDMDLTAAEHADRNPDGVIYYRIWNGRKDPKMPVFSEELSKEQVWALVAFVQTLRVRSSDSKLEGADSARPR
jgi:mono/diheme cytochrome c family protein